MTGGDPVPNGEALPYREAIRRLAEAGYREVDKGLYVETLAAHLERLAGQSPAAGEQLVRARPAEGAGGDPAAEVALFRIQRAGGREYADVVPFATVRRTPAGKEPPTPPARPG